MLGSLPAASTAQSPGEESPNPAATPAAPTDTARDNTLTVYSADGSQKVRIGGYMQSDSRMYLDESAEPRASSMLLRRARPQISGSWMITGEKNSYRGQARVFPKGA